MPLPRAAALGVATLFTAACNSVHDDLSRDLLRPPEVAAVTPGDFGLDAEAFDLPVGDGSLSGWFVRGDGARGRTVVLFHDATTDAGRMHAWWTFLARAGLNVCAFDYRGFGHSRGQASLRAAFLDVPALLDWLRSRPDVDPQRVAFHGLGFGAVVAMYSARRAANCRALVLEDVSSPRDAIRDRIAARGQMVSTIGVGFVEFAGLPDGVEPVDVAPQLSQPSLWIAGAAQPRESLRAVLRAYWAAAGDKQLWLLPDTDRTPHALLTHDGDYQRVVADYLATALDGDPTAVATTWRPVGDAAGRHGIEVELRRPPSATGPWAVQVAAADAAGEVTWQRTWLDADRASVRMELAAAPGVVAAMHLPAVDTTDDGTFVRRRTALSRAGAWYEANAAVFEPLRGDDVALPAARAAAALIAARDEAEPLPPLLEAELAATFATIGCALAASPEAADRAQARAWLDRAIAAAPSHPERHWWPGRTPHWGFDGQGAVARARAARDRLPRD